jgi:3-isopropylmalate/(R)-2-methylmalate dehydratase small subunit
MAPAASAPLRGRVWCVGDDLDTDQLIAGKYLTIIDPEELKRHVLENVDPSFSREAKPGDILVGGINFGCGSSREHAPAALHAIGLGAVLSDSFARIFFRNSINLGLPAVEAPGVRALFEPGDVAEVELDRGRITNVTRGRELRFHPFPRHLQEILDAGGLVEKVRRELSTGPSGASP